jgi:PAS domain S-box-containing protein
MDLLAVCCKCREVWEEVLGSIQQAIMVVEAEGRIVFGSPMVEKYLGFSIDELLGQELSTIFTPEDRKILCPNLICLIRKNELFEDELMLMRKDGSRFMAFMGLRPCFDPKDGQAIAIVSIQDIDRQKRMEKAFHTTHYEDLIKIANGIAHELRNPLVGIGGFVNRLYKKCEKVPDHQEYYGHIMTNLRKIETLVKKVELFASLPKPSMTDQCSKELISKAVEPYLEKIEERGIELDLRIEEQRLRMDGHMVIKAISILLENALDVVPEGGRIGVSSKSADKRYFIAVEDNGSGILPRDLPYIFNPFFSTKSDGAGIDLALVKRIAEGHGGQIKVESAPGQGSIFTLEFPVERRRAIRTQRLVV